MDSNDKVDIGWLKEALSTKEVWKSNAKNILDALNQQEIVTVADILIASPETWMAVLIGGTQIPGVIRDLIKAKATVPQRDSGSKSEKIEQDISNGFLQVGKDLATMSSQMGKDLGSMSELLKSVLLADKPESVKLSNMTASKVKTMLERLGFTRVEEEEANVSTNFAYTNFAWSYAIEDNAMTEQALKHLEEQLNQAKLIGRGKFSLIDTHSIRELFGTQIAGKILKGGVDGVIVPHKVHSSSVIQYRAMVELKNPDMIKQYSSISSQAIGELIAAAVISRHPVIAVVTDLSSVFHIYKLSGSQLQVYRNLKPEIGFNYLVTHLSHCSASIDDGVAVAQEQQHFPKEFEAIRYLQKQRPEDPVLSQMSDLMNFDESSDERFETALGVISSWRHLMYS